MNYLRGPKEYITSQLSWNNQIRLLLTLYMLEHKYDNSR